MITSKCLLQLLVFISVLGFGASFDSKVNLEDYMRYTPAPAPANQTSTGGDSLDTFTAEPSAAPTAGPTTDAPSAAPTESPTTLAPSEAPTVAASEVPTSAPTEPPTSSAPSNSPTETHSASPTEAATTSAPTGSPTEAATTAAPTKAPTTPPRLADAELELAQTEEPEKDEEEWGLFSETLEYVNSIGEVHIDFSLYSPNVTNLQMNFMKLKMGVCKSIDPLVCDLTHPIKEEGPEYCAIRDDVLLKDGVALSRREPIITDQDVSVMALGSTNVRDGEGIIAGSPIAWTTWRMSYNVLQLGNGVRQHINETRGVDLTEEEVNSIGLMMVQQMMNVNMERTLRSGLFEQDLNGFMKDIMLVASVVGEEVATYEPIVDVPSSHSPVHEGLELENGEDGEGGGGGLMIVFFFAGLGVACCVIVTLLYFSFRSRRSTSRRKRTIVILDDTSKSCTDSQGSASEEKTAAPVVDTSVLEEETPRARRHEPKRPVEEEEEEEPETDVENGATQEEASGTIAEGGDVESQWGRSMAQSSAYTGSISAITGVSGLEHSDTWSVGSMSIDLAEWG